MKRCVRDNPVNCTRELWVDGHLTECIILEALLKCPDMSIIPYPLNALGWVDGRVFGDPEAIPTDA